MSSCSTATKSTSAGRTVRQLTARAPHGTATPPGHAGKVGVLDKVKTMRVKQVCLEMPGDHPTAAGAQVRTAQQCVKLYVW